MINVEWPGLKDAVNIRPDICFGGLICEIRFSLCASMKIKEKDVADVGICLTGGNAHFVFKGWFSVAGAKQKRWWSDDHKGFKVPWTHLHKPETLLCILNNDYEARERIALMEENYPVEFNE
jgi:hypothetical protein